MTGFILLAAALIAAAMFWLTWPLFRPDVAAIAAPRQELESVRDRLLAQLQELEIQRANQSMDSTSAAAEQERLEYDLAQVLKRMEAAVSTKIADGGILLRAKWFIAVALILVLPLGAGGLYWLRQGETLTTVAATSGAQGNVPPNVLEMVSRLEQRLEAEPNDASGWAMLGRSYAALNRLQDAKVAYGKAYALAPDDAEILSGYAWVLYSENPAEPTPQAVTIYREILKREPNNLDAMWVLGLSAFQQGNYRQALQSWQKLHASLPAESPAAKGVGSAIEEAQARLKGSKAP